MSAGICNGCFFRPQVDYSDWKENDVLLQSLPPSFKIVKLVDSQIVRCRKGHIMKDYKDSFPSDYQPNTAIHCNCCKNKAIPQNTHYYHCDRCTDFDFCQG